MTEMKDDEAKLGTAWIETHERARAEVMSMTDERNGWPESVNDPMYAASPRVAHGEFVALHYVDWQNLPVPSVSLVPLLPGDLIVYANPMRVGLPTLTED